MNLTSLEEQKICAKEIMAYIQAVEIDGEKPDERDLIAILNKHFGERESP